MAELTEAWWKKSKAKTLLKEPLTDALKVYEKFEKARKAEPNQANYDAAETALVKGVLPAIKVTKEKCNASLHKETLAHLDALTKLAQTNLTLIQKHYDNMKNYLKAAHIHLAKLNSAWAKFNATPAPSTYEPLYKELKALEKFAENFAETRFFGDNLGQFHQKAHGVSEVADMYKAALGNPKADVKKLKGMHIELSKAHANMKGWLDKMKAPR